MNLSPIRDYVEANTTLIVGETLFDYSMPSGTVRGVLLVLDPSFGMVDHEIPGRFIERFQVIIRDPDYERGRERANEIYDLLNSQVTTDFGEFCTNYILPMRKPFPFKRSDGDQVEWTITFEARYFELP